MEKNKENIEIDIRRALFVLWSRIWIVVLVGILTAAIAFSFAFFFVTPTYSSSVKIYVNNIYSDKQGISSSEIAAAQNLANTYMVILKSRSVLDKVVKKTNLPYSTEQLSEMITAKSINETEVFEVVVTTADYKQAATIANAIAEVLPDRISEVVDGSSVRVVDYAQENPDRVAPSYQRYTALGAAIGILLSAAVIVLVDALDTTVISEEYLSHAYPQYPLLAVIPGANNPKNGYYKRNRRGYYRGYYQAETKKKIVQESGGEAQ